MPILPSTMKTRLIAFNLPQFHPIPENDLWWGKGFTEWTNVVKAGPLYGGHDKPDLPADLGFYDLRLPEARQAQADLAKEYDVGGFCYYHYWFNGRRLLERPVDEILASGKPDFPFCLCWANENWTRAWDGNDREILLGQSYSSEDGLAHIRHLADFFRDSRYIRVDGKPLFLIYRARHIPDPKAMTDQWRAEAERLGLPGLHLLRVESFSDEQADPRPLGFDGSVEFQPRGAAMSDDCRIPRRKFWHRSKLATAEPGFVDHQVFDYGCIAARAAALPWPDHPWFRCVAPSWDNTARRAKGGVILDGSTPEKYAAWLAAIVEQTERRATSAEPVVFVNAWNEWAEGCHLEPGQKWKRGYLEATKKVMAAAGAGR
jgi:lipopolysaccharide biosynthesis protein